MNRSVNQTFCLLSPVQWLHYKAQNIFSHPATRRSRVHTRPRNPPNSQDSPSTTGLCFSLVTYTPFSQFTWFSLLKTLSAFHTPLPSWSISSLFFQTLTFFFLNLISLSPVTFAMAMPEDSSSETEPAHFFSPGLRTIPPSQIFSSDTHQAIGWCRSCRRRWTRTFWQAEMLTSSCQRTVDMVLQVTWDGQQAILLTLKSLRFGKKKSQRFGKQHSELQSMATSDLPKTSPGGNVPLSLLHNYLHNTPQQQLPTWGTTLRLRQPQACSTSTSQARGMRLCHSYVQVRADKDTSEQVRSARHTGKHKWFYFTLLRAWGKHKL